MDRARRISQHRPSRDVNISAPPTRLRRVSHKQIDPSRVTLVVFCESERIVGRVSTLALNEQGEVKMMTTQGFDPAIQHAIVLAQKIASLRKQDVDVHDPNELWTPDLGKLD